MARITTAATDKEAAGPVVFMADAIFLPRSIFSVCFLFSFFSLCQICLKVKTKQKKKSLLASTETSLVLAGEAICVMQGPPPSTHHQRPGGDTLPRIPQPAVHRERSV